MKEKKHSHLILLKQAMLPRWITRQSVVSFKPSIFWTNVCEIFGRCSLVYLSILHIFFHWDKQRLSQFVSVCLKHFQSGVFALSLPVNFFNSQASVSVFKRKSVGGNLNILSVGSIVFYVLLSWRGSKLLGSGLFLWLICLFGILKPTALNRN